MHKTEIFDQKNNAKKFFLPTYLPYFFMDCYRKKTISFFRPKGVHVLLSWNSKLAFIGLNKAPINSCLVSKPFTLHRRICLEYFTWQRTPLFGLILALKSVTSRQPCFCVSYQLRLIQEQIAVPRAVPNTLVGFRSFWGFPVLPPTITRKHPNPVHL